MKSRFTSALVAAMFVVASLPAMGQGFYDDDIYDASKPVVKPVKTEKTKPAKQQSTQQVETFPSLSGTGYYYGGDGNIYPEYKAAGSYNYDSGNTRSVDEYNRRGIFAYSAADSLAQDSLGDSFAYTRRLERFHNPDLVSGSADETLKEYYYSENTAPTTSINVYVVDGWPYYSNPYRYGYFGPSWSFTWGYRPWLSWGWGYYDPYWAWASPGWGWNWGWGAGWGPAWGPGWGGPAWAGPIYGGNWRRPSGVGSSMTHGRGYAGAGRVSGGRPAAGVGSRPGSFNNHGVSTGARPGSVAGGARPGANVRPGANAAGANARPGYTPNAHPGSSTHYGVGTRPGAGTQHQQPNYNNNHNSNRNTGNYSRPSSGGGSRGGGFSGGGSRGGGSRGGGGGGRGCRR